jgi:hypothetical protein
LSGIEVVTKLLYVVCGVIVVDVLGLKYGVVIGAARGQAVVIAFPGTESVGYVGCFAGISSVVPEEVDGFVFLKISVSL